MSRYKPRSYDDTWKITEERSVPPNRYQKFIYKIVIKFTDPNRKPIVLDWNNREFESWDEKLVEAIFNEITDCIKNGEGIPYLQELVVDFDKVETVTLLRRDAKYVSVMAGLRVREGQNA